MITPRRPVSSEAGVSLGATSAYTPRSRTLRAMRWQYCPPASRTVICGFKLLIVLRSILLGSILLVSILVGAKLNGFGLAQPLHHHLLGGVQQGLGPGHGRDGLLHFRILFHGNLARFVHAERGDVYLALQLLPDPLAIRAEISFREFDLVLPQETSEIVHHLVVRFPTLGQLCVLPRSKEFRREIVQRVLAEHLGLKLVVLCGRVLLVRRDSAAAVNRPAAVGHLHVLSILLIQVRVRVIIQER